MIVSVGLKLPILKLLFDYASRLSLKKHLMIRHLVMEDFVKLFSVEQLEMSEQELYLIFLQS